MLTEGKTKGCMKHHNNGSAPLNPPGGPPSPKPIEELNQRVAPANLPVINLLCDLRSHIGVQGNAELVMRINNAISDLRAKGD